MASALCTAGALFAKHRLQSIQELLTAALETRIGAEVELGALAFHSLGGVTLEDFATRLPIGESGSVDLRIPEGVLKVNLLDLLQGTLRFDEVHLAGAEIHLALPPEDPWGSVRGFDGGRNAEPFRFTGEDCALVVEHGLADSPLKLHGIAFDVTRPRPGAAVFAEFGAVLAHEPESPFRFNLRYAAPDDFELSLDGSAFEARGFNSLLPAAMPPFAGGSFAPHLRVEGRAGRGVVFTLDAEFERLAVDGQPAFIDTERGWVSVHGAYKPETRHCAITAARFDTASVEGRVDGTIALDGPLPVFDLRVELSRLAAAALIEDTLLAGFAEFGELELRLEEPFEVVAAVHGTPLTRIINAHASVPAGRLRFSPAPGQNYPELELELGALDAIWNTGRAFPDLSFAIKGGAARHAASGFEIEGITGALRLDGARVEIAPFNGTFTGHPMVGNLWYDLETHDAELSVNASLIGIEYTQFAERFHQTELAGAASVRFVGTKSGNAYRIQADVDATHTQIERNWWFNKPPGVGAVVAVEGSFTPRGVLSLSVDGEVAASPLHAELEAAFTQGAWQVQQVTARAPTLDVATVDRCLRLPYRLSGAGARNGVYEWRRMEDGWQLAGECELDEFTFVPLEGDAASTLRGVRVRSTVRHDGMPRTQVNLNVNDAQMAPIRSKWLVPLRSDPALLEKYPPVEHELSFSLAAENISMPPWRGTAFRAGGYGTRTNFGLREFDVAMGGDGRLEGSYAMDRIENTYSLHLNWERAPASYFLAHLELPHLLSGPATGELTYFIDRDDPGTLEGEGRFELGQGQFSADYLLAQFGDHFGASEGGLPPVLEFDELAVDLNFAWDLIETPMVRLRSPGITMEGSGHFILGGDLDYDLRVKVAPDVAERIAVLRDNINVQGHRLAQQDIELAFKVTGPALQPRGALTEAPPVSVTLASGVLAVTSDAFRVIDTPRKILVDLLKLGGGLLSAPKRQD